MMEQKEESYKMPSVLGMEADESCEKVLESSVQHFHAAWFDLVHNARRYDAYVQNL